MSGSHSSPAALCLSTAPSRRSGSSTTPLQSAAPLDRTASRGARIRTASAQPMTTLQD